MSLTSLEISGYRGFKTKGKISFAVPSGKPGSGLTLITGPNNSGKSSILECLKLRMGHQSPSFTVGARNASTEWVEVKYLINGREEIVRSTQKGGSESIKVDVDPEFEIYVLPSRRTFNPYFNRSEYTRKDYLVHVPHSHHRTPMLNNFEYRLFNILKDPRQFNKVLEEVLQFRPEWSIDQSDQGQYFLKFFNGGHSHSSDGMGEGIVSIFSIVDSLYDSRPGDVVVIDEPELSLHPSLQKRLSKVLSDYAKDRQIVISTHSPYFINLGALKDGGHIARVITSPDGTLIHEVTPMSKRSLSLLSEGNLYNPHVFGLDARELFFQEDRIILTEGQEDVLLLPKVAEQLNKEITGHFFGWGAGGADNIRHCCLILKDLGYQKVAGVLDGDKINVRDKLRAEFPEYWFDCIPAKDIRTKPARKSVDKVDGLLDGNMLIKAEYSEGVEHLFEELNKHMEL